MGIPAGIKVFANEIFLALKDIPLNVSAERPQSIPPRSMMGRLLDGSLQPAR